MEDLEKIQEFLDSRGLRVRTHWEVDRPAEEGGYGYLSADWEAEGSESYPVTLEYAKDMGWLYFGLGNRWFLGGHPLFGENGYFPDVE